MTESAVNLLSCLVGTYEIWQPSQLPARDRRRESPDTPLLVQVGPAQRITPKREALEMAIRLLLKTKIPKQSISLKRHIEMQVDEIRLDDRAAVKWAQMRKRLSSSRADFTDIGKAALIIAGHLGMLDMSGGEDDPITGLGYRRYQSLDRWAKLADEIQAIFYGREIRKRIPTNFVLSSFHTLRIVLTYVGTGVSMHLLPPDTGTALIYYAAQMVAAGTKLQNCEHCHLPFLSGGEGRGGGKRRRDARFCSDECRWQFHNEARRKRKL
jgi:hypothetical protein